MLASRAVAHVDSSLRELVPRYLERRAADVAALREAARDGAFPEAHVIGHRMKGSGGGYGFDPITRMGERIETAAATLDAAGILAAADDLARYIVDVEVVFVEDE